MFFKTELLDQEKLKGVKPSLFLNMLSKICCLFEISEGKTKCIMCEENFDEHLIQSSPNSIRTTYSREQSGDF